MTKVTMTRVKPHVLMQQGGAVLFPGATSEKDQGTYRLGTKPLVRAGKYYYGFTCAVCGEAFAALDDTANGMVLPKFVGDGHIRAQCSHCGADRLYSPEQVE